METSSGQHVCDATVNSTSSIFLVKAGTYGCFLSRLVKNLRVCQSSVVPNSALLKVSNTASYAGDDHTSIDNAMLVSIHPINVCRSSSGVTTDTGSSASHSKCRDPRPESTNAANHLANLGNRSQIEA